MRDAGSMQPGVLDGLGGGREQVVLMRQLLVHAEFTKHAFVLRLYAGEEDGDSAMFEPGNRVGKDTGAGCVHGGHP